MANEEVKLLSFWVSPFCRRIEWALKVKGIDFEYIEEDIYNKSQLLAELNPVHKKVPVLVHNGKPISESFVILEYIDETWKQHPLLPRDPYQRAKCRFWAKAAEEKVSASAWILMCYDDEERRGEALSTARDALEKIEQEIKGKKFFGGETIGYMDIALGWISYWLPVWEEIGGTKILEPQKFPAVTAWMNNFLNHPVIKDCLPPRDKMLDYFLNHPVLKNIRSSTFSR